ncbi:xanthine dehydrogenase accessory factor [Brevibacterium sanguinis]|uniref:Xanthine dehydrogenase accessory factor n=2 Tax=Brevibacterium TaxID=1696 RepID=A0A366IGG5_9MICO|nr:MULTISPECIES: XdhC family protein [Brevibacterium]RBP62200.1 xanthine dehydrogenase accessory factor [Brevibacterium sanguinis]RBP70668.1 xanthine dehydrogenase accessory factor [Brevibacterium celere]
MRDIAAGLRRWLTGDEPFVLAVIARTWSSAPRPAGTMMAVSSGGEVLGSLSGGCVEGAVYELAQEVLDDGLPRAAHYGVSDDDAFAVGLTCGGHLDVVLRRFLPRSEEVRLLTEAVTRLDADEPFALAMPVATGTATVQPGEPLGRLLLITDATAKGALSSARLDEAIAADARGWLAAGRTGILTIGTDGQRLHDDQEVLVVSLTPRPRMIVFGAIDYARALAELASFVGYRVTVCDARPIFATPRRFPSADEVVTQWPHRYLEAEIVAGRITATTVIAMLTHDLKFDVPLLEVALRCEVGFIGAMGSRRTNEQREQLLREAGIGEAELSRLHAPIGLDIGARTPEATAVSIIAEVVQCLWGGSGLPLRTTDGPIHQI